MIKVFVRAVVPTTDSYLLMGGYDKNGEETWDLPGGELKAGVDVKQHLRKIVLENTGYAITDLNFFEVTCKVVPRGRGIDPLTTLDFIFSSKIEAPEVSEPTMNTELLRFEKFEWFESSGQYRENKVIALLTRYHHNQIRKGDEARLKIDLQPAG
jgi:hypothetical protein